MGKLYLFDFDGTISKKDSMIAFAKFINPISLYYIKAIVFFPIYFLLLSRIIDNQKAKHLFLRIFIGRYSQERLEYSANQFASYFMNHLKKEAVDYLKKIEAEDPTTKCVIVSSSLNLWLLPIIEKMGLEYCICTKVNFKNERYHSIDVNCYGKEKAIRIKETCKLKDFNEILVFGDSKGDTEMLELATHKHYNFFK